MMSHPLYGKKKKTLRKCPNPLFSQWLKEWRDEAAEKGTKSQYTYGKALKTIQKFPLELKLGRDCKILENFGDKICKMLDDKLEEHVALYGSAVPVVTQTASPKRAGPKKAPKKADPAIRRNPVPDMAVDVGAIPDLVIPPPRARAQAHQLSDSDSEQEQQQPARKRQRSGRAGDREYVPAYRSGPYAILLTLYRNMQLEDTRGFMTKAELVRDAQPLADKSFSFPDPSSRYTAWSSVGSLIKKGLIIKDSSPAKYSLTDSGCELAHRLEAVARENEAGQDLHGACAGNGTGFLPDRAPRLPRPPSPPRIPRATLSPRVPAVSSPSRLPDPQLPPGLPDLVTTENDFGLEANFEAPSSSKQRLKYWYIQEDGSETLVKDKAVVTIDEDIGAGFLIKCNYRELLQAGVRYKLDTSRPVGDDFVYVYLSNLDTEEIAMPPPYIHGKESKTIGEKSNSSKVNKSAKSSRSETTELPSLTKQSDHRINENGTCLISKQKESTVVVLDSEESSLDSVYSVYSGGLKGLRSDHQDSAGSGLSLMDRLSSKLGSCAVPRSLVGDSKENSQESCSQASIQSLSSVSSAATDTTLPEPDFVLRPGEFDVVLCVDNAEFYGASKGTSKNLLPDLLKNGVDCNLRKLHVGDLLWIAKEKMNPLPGQLEQPQGRELVLNYIIERKRMDDLVGSCLDGRFKEQKFRLKKCGIPRPMYLIEDYGSMQHFSLPESTIKQAITNTQVIDGFQVKRTKDSKETVAFLTVFTRYLQSSFKHKTLLACGLDRLREGNVTNSIHDAVQKLPTFAEFNQSSVKSKALTVQEMFGKQLIQLHGMSAEKARAVIEKYPTPTHLLQSYDECLDTRAREMLLSLIKCGKSARSLGQAQSKQISQLYNAHTALS